jgi:DNA-binding response OmpR family regulator
VLLIEDDPALRQMLSWELSEFGYRTQGAGGCREARAALRALDFELALLDVDLPDGCGSELSADLAAARPDRKIILCSGRHITPDRRRLPPQVLAILTKPLQILRIDDLFSTGH